MTALTDSIASVVHEYKYLVFGEIVADSGDTIENPFTYTSRELDRETGLMFYRARYYDPHIGRFISEDPIEFVSGDKNFYRYVRNCVLKFIDPNGLDGEEDVKTLGISADSALKTGGGILKDGAVSIVTAPIPAPGLWKKAIKFISTHVIKKSIPDPKIGGLTEQTANLKELSGKLNELLIKINTDPNLSDEERDSLKAELEKIQKEMSGNMCPIDSSQR